MIERAECPVCGFWKNIQPGPCRRIGCKGIVEMVRYVPEAEAVAGFAAERARADNAEAERDAMIEMWNRLIGELHVAVGRPGEGLTDEELVAEVERLCEELGYFKTQAVVGDLGRLRTLVAECYGARVNNDGYIPSELGDRLRDALAGR